jgi:hypothetical protein
MRKPERKSGRPGRDPTPGERVGLSLRVTPKTKRALDKSAATLGRSLSQEAEARLEQSFRNEDLLPQVLDLAYGREGAGLLMMIGLCIPVARWAGPPDFDNDPFGAVENWMSSPWASFQVADAIRRLLYEICPPERPEPPEALAKTMLDLSKEVRFGLEISGQRTAHAALKILINPSSHHSLGPATQPIRDRLAVVIERLKSKTNAG